MGLENQGRQVLSVPVYQWSLPPNTQPLRDAVDDLLAGHFGAVIFTTGIQIDHFLQVAAEGKQSEQVKEASAPMLRGIYRANLHGSFAGAQHHTRPGTFTP